MAALRAISNWDDLVSRRLDPNTLTSEQALEQAKALARATRDISQN
jgi:hypothetical protein